MKTTVIQNTFIEIENSGRITISSNDMQSQTDLTELTSLFTKRIQGRMFRNQYGQLVFEPYQKSASMPTVLLKEIIGQVTVVRTPKMMKFSLALPIEMSNSMMQMTIFEQANLLAKALHTGGLYERMKNPSPISAPDTLATPSTQEQQQEQDKAA